MYFAYKLLSAIVIGFCLSCSSSSDVDEDYFETDQEQSDDDEQGDSTQDDDDTSGSQDDDSQDSENSNDEADQPLDPYEPEPDEDSDNDTANPDDSHESNESDNSDTIENPEPEEPELSKYITKVFDYMPGVGQCVNLKPLYESGDSQEDMNAKVLIAIGGSTSDEITLGGYGGYVVVGFDQQIMNREGERDFRILSSAGYRSSYAPCGGTFEPGIVMVAIDTNANGIPDDEWYEIAGSAHLEPTSHSWYGDAAAAGEDCSFYDNFQITYYRSADGSNNYYWEDNMGGSGYRVDSGFEDSQQPYFPEWYSDDKLTFSGSRLPSNGVNMAAEWYPVSQYVLYRFGWGYADNAESWEDDACIDISWAQDSYGNVANLDGVDFVKIYTGVNQECDWLGEVSTKLSGIEIISYAN